MLLIGSTVQDYVRGKTDFVDFGKKKDIDILTSFSDAVYFLKNHPELKIKRASQHFLVCSDGSETVDLLLTPSDSVDADKLISNDRVKYRKYYLSVPSMGLLNDIYVSNYLARKQLSYEDIFTPDGSEIYDYQYTLDRVEETRKRIASKKEKEAFFHKHAKLPEHIEHDLLHEIVADAFSLDKPTYKKFVTENATDVKEDQWNKLMHFEKISRCVEETTVIYLERSYVPSCIRNKKRMPLNYKMLARAIDHVNVKGLKDQPDYITEFGRANQEEISKQIHAYIYRVLNHYLLRTLIVDMIEGHLKPYYSGK